jgi:hypothetical protein
MLRRSTRPPPQTPKQKLAMIVRSFRSPDRPPVGALLAGISAQELRDRAKAFTSRQVLDDAFEVYLQAIGTLRRATEAQKLVLRGVSIDLLAQLSEMALEADDLAAELESLSKTRGSALAEAQTTQRTVTGRALAFREQARRMLARVTGEGAGAQDLVRNAATAAGGSGSLVDGLRQLASLGHTLLASEDPATRQRAALLGLDAAYVKQIAATAREVHQAEQAVWKLTAGGDTPDARLREMLGSTLAMMSIVVEAFDTAHELDASVPVLRPKHTQLAVVRRRSRLPPPMARPAPTAAKAGGAAPPRAAASSVRTPPSEDGFHGGLGKR